MTAAPFAPGANRSPLAPASIAVAVAILFLVPTTASLGGQIVSAAEGAGSHLTASPVAAFAKLPLSIPKTNRYDWPELHQNPYLSGYANNSPLSTVNASSMGVAWDTNLYGGALDSPAVAYDSILGITLVYVGTETGNVLAINLANGQIVWGLWLGSPIRSSPLVHDGSVYIVPFTTATLYKFNATTGATQCTVALPEDSESTPTIATLPNGVTSLFIGSASDGNIAGPLIAINVGNCSIEWTFDKFHTPGPGEWDSVSYTLNASGVPMVFVGTSDPDSSIYAVNALTGQLVWRFQCYNPDDADDDVGAGPMISPPGKNGFAQGVIYVTNKAGIAYAIDLNNGTLIWETDFNALAGIIGAGYGQSRSTPALDGTNVVFGFAYGLFDLNATTGAEIWMYKDPTQTESIASPAIAGMGDTAVVVTGDVGGDFDVLSLAGGTQLYSYQTGGWIASSPAVSDGNVLIASSDGFLYDFAVGGGNDAILPTSSISSPAQGAELPNPNGDLTVYGNATDSRGVTAVDVGIQSSGPAGPWWDAATGRWSPGPIFNLADLGTPGGLSTSWTMTFPVPKAGGSYEVFANPVSVSGQTGLNTSLVNFDVNYSTQGPHLEATPSYVAPGGTVTVNGGGFGRSVKVKISFLNTTLATVKSTPEGALPTTEVVIPTWAVFGPSSIVATAQKTGEASSAPINIANSWDQLGYSPGHDGYEPNDPLLHQIIFPGGLNPLWIPLAWRFHAAAPINASPVVADGVAYVGDTQGNLYAVEIHNGGMLWNFTLSTSASIDVSPAVDPTLGLVFVGAADGTLYAIRTSSGTLDWSTHIGGNVSAPVYSGGEIYVSSTKGVIEAVNESTGSVAWSVTLASGVPAAPALNPTTDRLFVGESNGDLVSLNASSGRTVWTYSTAGAVTASPMLANGIVYFGSNDDLLYAVEQTTGALHWSFETGGPVQVTPTVDNKGFLWVGSDDGYLYVLRGSKGTEQFNFSIGSPIVGLASTEGVTVFEDAAGTIGAQKTFWDIAGWRYPTEAGLTTAPLVLDTGVYVGAGDGFLYAFTSFGQPPV